MTILFGLAVLVPYVAGVAPEFGHGQFVHAVRRLPLADVALALAATAVSLAG